MKQLRSYAGQIILFVLSLAAAFIGVNWSYQSVLPEDDRFLGLGKHGWLIEGATLNLPKLASAEHQIKFGLEPGRPHELGPALIRPTICGVAASPLVVPPDQLSFSVTLPARCHKLTLHVENPFVPGR